MNHAKLLGETLIPFDAAHRLLPGNPTRDQLNHWRDDGILIRRGEKTFRVYLECCRIGGRPHTSKEAFLRFFGLINGDWPIVPVKSNAEEMHHAAVGH